MAQIQTETIVITFSKLVKESGNNPGNASMTDDDMLTSLEAVAQELVGPGVIVEAVKA